MRLIKNALIGTLLLAACLGPRPASAQSPGAAAGQFGIDRYLNIRSSTSPALSPNGDRIAFLTNITGTPQVWMVDAKGGWPEQMTFYDDRVDFIRWSPDGAGLVFAKSKGGDENAQLYWLAPDGSVIKPLTNNPLIRYNFGAWSHNGKKISYASNKRNKDFFDVYVMDIATGHEALVYQQDGSNSPVTWSFDDRYLIVSHVNEKLSLDNDLYLVDTQTSTSTYLTPHEGAAEYGDVYFAPSGHSVFLATNNNREFNSLSEMDLKSKKIDVIDDTPWDLSATEMSDDGAYFAYTLNRDGFSELFVRTLDTDGKPLITVMGPKGLPIELPGKGVVSGLQFSKDNSKLAFVFNGARHNSDIWLYDLKSRTLSQVTHSSTAGIPNRSFVEPRLVHYKSFDGREIPAWYYTENVQVDGIMPRRRVIVSVHGGPEGQEQPTFSGIYQYFLSRGYAILAPNVRGSTGYGKTYTHLDDVLKREDSVKDLAAAVEWLKKEGGADAKRIAVMGGSYGGYMTLAAVTLYPELWAAAVDTVGIANFESFLKNTSGYRRKLREVEYGSLERDVEFLRSISPLTKVDRIKAPMMVIQGKNDPRVPYTEAEQIVKALRERGSPVEYKLFDDEGHGIVKLSNRLIVYPLVADFLDKYMK